MSKELFMTVRESESELTYEERVFSESNKRTMIILLTKGKTSVIDTIDSDISRVKWYAQKSLRTYYAVRHGWDKKLKKDFRVLMHREIMSCPKGFVVDHIDGNGLNNQRSNLRICTSIENSYNRKINIKLKYKGVVFNGKKYIASIWFKKKRIHLGCFNTEIEAANCYNISAIKYHGKFARLNKST